MYSLEQLRQGVENPRAALRELNRLYWTRLGGRDYNTGGTALFEEDWDNCLILDGCRYDTFADVGREFDLDGTLDSRESRGSATAEFHEVVDVWGDAIDYGDDGVPPEPLAEAARDAAVEYPDKRLLVHFVQPHAPYLGERGRAAFPDYRSNPLADKFLGRIDAPERLLRTVYRENLELVLSEVEGLLPDLPGKTAVTADHGMLLGEREFPVPIRGYGHPERVYTDEMVEVPWFVAHNGARKNLVAEPSVGAYGEKQTAAVDEQAREHLEQMGYL
ncbi:hypothetical protein [Halorussus caseinilyticus]|uniref:hypothetical protein n=1 Tax=Halorussus caseinilyticus TaxID=3034025 RepID=UPI0023E897B2|nr:hypothetical protein [Halorussus sp. DT72]